MTPQRAPISIRLRVTILVLVWEVILLAGGGAVLLYHQRRLLTAAFDSGLESDAESIAAMLQYEPVTGQIRLEASERVLSRFSRSRRPDVFAVLGPSGSTLPFPLSDPDLPEWVHPTASPEARDFRHRGRHYRGMILPTVAEASDRDTTASVVVFMGESRSRLDSRIGDSIEYSLLFGVIFVLVSGATIWWAAGRGTAPIKKLARMTRRIDERSLGHRFLPLQFPRELQPLASDFNGLLGRLDLAFERERRFSADAAHELRTPIASLKAGVQAALLASPTAAGADRGLLADLLADIERLETLCESLLEAARAEGSSTADRSDAGVVESEVRGAAEALATRANRAIAVEVAIDPDTPPLRTSASSAGRIISNLIENALRYAGPDANITVSIAAGTNGGVITVEDDGAGIPEEVAPRIFERFVRADKHRARTMGGAGLGLAICRSLARGEGGDLTYEPRSPSGCRFVWRIIPADVEG